MGTIEYIHWNDEKDKLLQQTRGLSFEMMARHILQGDFVDVIDHPNQERYPGQQIMVIVIDDYAYLVPYVEQEGQLFLKTIMPSRKATRMYITKK